MRIAFMAFVAIAIVVGHFVPHLAVPFLAMALIDLPDLTTVRTGDTLPGSGGMTTSSTTNQTVLQAYGEDFYASRPVYGSGLIGTAGEHPIPWWIALGVLLIIVKFAAEKAGEEGDFRNVRIGALNIVIITLCAIFGITVAKWVLGVYTIPGLSAMVEAV